MSASETGSAFGIGIVYFNELEELQDTIALSAYDALEIEPQTLWSVDPAGNFAANLGKLESLAALPAHRLVHSVGLPVGNAAAPRGDALALLAQSVRQLGAAYASEHLSFNSADSASGERWTGFLLPPPQTLDGVAVAVERLRLLREALGVPVAFETGVNYFPPRAGELDDGEFFAAVAHHADCGLLLDLHNLLANELNGRAGVESVLASLPLDKIWEIHVAGGHAHRGFYLDAHHGLVSAELRRLTERVAPRLPNLRAIVFEAHPESLRSIGRAAHDEQCDWLRKVWEARGTRAERPRRRPALANLPNFSRAKARVARYERETIERIESADSRADASRASRAYGLLRELIEEARGGMLLRSVPFVTRLLLATIGTTAFRTLFERYCEETFPGMFSAQEGWQFLTFLEGEARALPYLREAIDFERALLTVVATGATQRLYFPYNPADLFVALARRSLPRITDREPYGIEIRPDGIRLFRRQR